MQFNYGRHNVNDADIEAVVRVLRSDYLTSGSEVPRFEKNIADFCGVKYGVAVNSGTSAIECALSAIGVQGTKVIVPNITFVATANAVVHQGGEVILCDTTESGHIDVSDLERILYETENISAVISVDYAGIPCDYDSINDLCVRYNINHISDAAHSLGASYCSREKGLYEQVGALADITCFSFHPVKTITTAEGGMCVTDNRLWAEYMRLYRSHGVNIPVERREGYEYDVILTGHNYRMNELQAALGNSQFKRLPDFISQRNVLARRYIANIGNNPKLAENITITSSFVSGYECVSAWHIFVVVARHRDMLYKDLKNMGINCNVHYLPINSFSLYKDGRKCPTSEEMAAQFLTLPLHYNMSEADVDYICDKIASLY